jgi:hypothetical protein
MQPDAAFDLVAAPFELAGASLVAHVLLSQLLRVLVRWQSPLAMGLFAVPNAPIAPDLGFRLLRARYFWPWSPQPLAMSHEPFGVRIIFWCARLTGAATPLLALAFLGTAVYIGVHDA